MPVKYSTAILVGGKSSRMGQDKALLKLNNERFIDRLLREFAGSGEIFLSVAHKEDYADIDVPKVADENRDIGPIEGIRQALIYAHEDYVFVCAADMPFVKKEMADYLADYISSDNDAYVFRDEKRSQPLCAIYHRSILPVIEEQISKGKYCIADIFSHIRVKYIDLTKSCFDTKTLRNINTGAEYRSILQPVVFCVSGIKNSGKTYLIEKIINEFIQKGLSVGVIKHDGHDFECDTEGTDSYRFYQAGAEAVAVYSADQSFLHEHRHIDAEELIERMRDRDVIIIEGLKDSAYPKVEVIRAEVFSKSVCRHESLICIATDVEIPENTVCPIFGIDDVKGIFCCIMDKLFDV